MRLRNILIGAAALTLPLVTLTGTAGASTSPSKATQAKFIKALHAWAPATKQHTDKSEVSEGDVICLNLEMNGNVKADAAVGQPKGTTAVEVTFSDFVNENSQVLINSQNSTGSVVAGQTLENDIFGVSVLELCPRFEPAVKYLNSPGGPFNAGRVPTTSKPSKSEASAGDAGYAYSATPPPTSVGAGSGNSVPTASCTSSGIARVDGDPGDQVIPTTGVLSQVSLTGRANGGLQVTWTFNDGVPIPTSQLAYMLDVDIFQKRGNAGDSVDTSFDVILDAGGLRSTGNQWKGNTDKYDKAYPVTDVIVSDGSASVLIPRSSLPGLKQPFYWDAQEDVTVIPTTSNLHSANGQAFCPNAKLTKGQLTGPVPYAKFPSGTSRVTETTTTNGVGQSAASASPVTTTTATGNDQPPSSSEPTNTTTPSPTSSPPTPSTTTTTVPCITGTASSTISVTNTPYDNTSVGATEYMIDVSGVVTNNANGPLDVYSLSYTLDSVSETMNIDQTLPPGGTFPWDTGPFNSANPETSVAVTGIMLMPGSEGECFGG